MYLNQSIQIGTMQVANRLVLPPMHTGSSPDGAVTKKHIEYYTRRSANGAIGLIITEFCYISQQGKANKTQVSMADDCAIPSHCELVKAVHQEGSKIICQINHAGFQTNRDITGMEAVAPSAAIPSAGTKPGQPLPKALSVEEIHTIERDFVAAAERAKKAGYDGVEIHAAHGYLYNQFFSPLSNHRQDEYGCGSVEDRARIITETVKLIRDSVGSDFVIAVRLGGCDYTEGGSTIADCAQGAYLIQMAGADLLDVSGGFCGPYLRGSTTPGYFKESSQAAKAAISLPVILTGGITEPDQAEELLQAEYADMIGVGRALFKDADWARKIAR